MANDVDISENDLLRSHPEVLRKLLLDHTTHKNIFWATDSYAHLGEDFTSSSDINWSASVADIDQQLYHKYGLSADEIAFIEKMIKPME